MCVHLCMHQIVNKNDCINTLIVSITYIAMLMFSLHVCNFSLKDKEENNQIGAWP